MAPDPAQHQQRGVHLNVARFIGLLIVLAVLGAAGCERYLDSTDPGVADPGGMATPRITSAAMLDGAVILTWRVDNPRGIVRYRIYATDATDTAGGSYLLRDSTTATTDTITNLPASQWYLFRVAAVRSTGYEGPRSEPFAASVQHLSIAINDGSEYTSNRTVQVRVNAPAGFATHIMMSEAPGLTDAAFTPLFGTAAAFTLSTGDGVKRVYAKLQFEDGLVTAAALVDSITLDTQAEIDSVYFGDPGADGYFGLGDVVTFGLAAAGERGGAAAVSFAGAGTVTLADDGTGGDDAAGDGRYHGRWTVPAGFTLAAGLVTGTFTDAAGNRRQAAAPRFLTVYTPPAPVTATALATGPTTVALSWTSSLSSIFAAYRVYRSTSSGVGNEATLLTTITAQATTTYDDTGLTPGTTYYYRVDTVDRSGLAARSLVVSARPQ